MNFIKKYNTIQLKANSQIIDYFDYLLFYLSEGDIKRVPEILKIDYETCLKFYYLNRIKKINEIQDNIDYIKYLERK